MKKLFQLLLLLTIIFFSNCQCSKKNDLSPSTGIDLTPQKTQYLNAAPNAVTMVMRYNGSTVTLVESRLRNAAISNSNSNIPDSDIIAGKAKLFDIKAFTAGGVLIFSEKLRVSTTMRTNYPDNQNRILHDENSITTFDFPVSLSYNKDALPASVVVREIPVIEGKIDTTLFEEKAKLAPTHQIKIDSIIK